MQAADRAPTALDPALRERVLDRLGLAAAPAADLGGLRALYAAWCAHVPFDNVRKMIALRTGADRPLPGGHAAEFFASWLEHGAGGTCWPTSNALYELIRSLGFEAQRITAAMRDLGIVNHASVKVALEGREWLVDSAMLTNVPLPLGERVFVGEDPVFAVEVEPVEGTHLVWTHTPPNPAYMPCRLLPGAVGLDEYLRAYESSREHSPFNRRLYARRNRPSELLLIYGRTRVARTRAGLESRELSREELCAALRTDIGLSGALVEQWVRSGALEASFEPLTGPTPPRDARLPPSMRAE